MHAYLHEQAELLLAMSRQTIDLGMAERLRNLAADMHERAADLERSAGGDATSARSNDFIN
jgi:hypothetical protein